ncbi:hypothetical protein [Kiloniella majae]|uniref:hypothetical protein n=1 Tax=Kiloniella majae TaxID=1938558 RepID=UPI000A2779F9|nr:hypothetical protein [Kiloniella majae]
MSRWGQANIEVLASKPYITDELRRGVPMQRLYNELYAKQWITVSYNSFRLKARVIKQEITATNESSPQVASIDDQFQSKKPQPKIVTKSSPIPSNKKFILSPISDLKEFNRRKN